MFNSHSRRFFSNNFQNNFCIQKKQTQSTHLFKFFLFFVLNIFVFKFILSEHVSTILYRHLTNVHYFIIIFKMLFVIQQLVL